MKKVKYIFIFLIVLVVTDQSIGYFSKRSLRKVKTGMYGTINKAMQDSRAPAGVILRK